MNTINTIAPIAIEELKKYFVDDTTEFIIDYKNSTLKGSKLLIYLGNLNVPCDLDAESDNEFLELLKDYFNAKTLVSIPKLELAAIEVLFGNKELLDSDYQGILSLEQVTNFNKENSEIIEKWVCILDSLTLYNMKIVNVPEFHEFVESFPTNDTDELTGINFVNILRYQDFYLYYGKINEKNLTNYRRYFSEYMFKGKNLFHFWANEVNPLFLINMGIANGFLKPGELAAAADKDIAQINALAESNQH
jgi:hypothetical protein